MGAVADWRRVRRLGRYLVRDRRRLLVALPVSYTHLTLPTS